MATLNDTHDAKRRSWVAAANSDGADFPIQNLPFGVFSRGGAGQGGVAIGDRIVDLSAALDLFSGEALVAAKAASGPTLNGLMALGNAPASALRARLSDLLREGGPDDLRRIADTALVQMAAVDMLLPARTGAFTDFLTSSYHTERGGRASRPDSPLPPCFKYLPVAYNSRASSLRASGAAITRPNGQWKHPDGEVRFGPSAALDFELEVGLFIGPGNPVGTPVPMSQVQDRMFGYCLLNDWSARDIQAWESALGPFLSKSLSTSISPWVVTAEALAPFRAPAFPRAADDPAPLPYLTDAQDQAAGHFDIVLEAFIRTPKMHAAGALASRVALTNFQHNYWTFAQMATHHMSNGCNLEPGDLLGSGTASGPTDDSRACLSEATERGKVPLTLDSGETRAWLLDGDEVIFTGRASRDGFVSIGFGTCAGRINPAPAWPA
jgi:fumarylacetoacetase